MKFKGNGIIWDKEKNKILCKFVKGVYETTDKRVIDKLKEIDSVTYEEIVSKDFSPDIEEKVKTRKQLVQEVKDLEIKGADRMSRDELQEALK